MTPRPDGWAVTRARASRLLVTACCVLLLAVTAAPAGAQLPADEAEVPPPDVGLRLVDISGVVAPGDEVTVTTRVHHRGGAATEGLRLVAAVTSRATSRLDFRQAVDQGGIGERALLGAVAVDVPDLTRGRSVEVEVPTSTGELGIPGGLDGTGVYPLRLQLLDGSDVVATAVTAVVVIGDEVGEAVSVAMLVGLDSHGTVDADGAPDEVLAADLGLGGRLTSTAASLAAAGDVPISIATSSRVLEDLLAVSTHEAEGTAAQVQATAAARVVADVQEALGREATHHVALPYGPADLVALVRGGLESEAQREVFEGAVLSERLGGASVDTRVLWPHGAVDAATLASIQPTGVTAMVLSESAQAVPATRALPTSPPPLRRLTGPNTPSLEVLVPDPFLEETIDAGIEGGARAARQRLLAETAVTYFERPFAEEGRGLLIDTGQVPEIGPGVIEGLLSDLAAAPWADPVGIDTLRERLSPSAGQAVRLGAVDDDALLAPGFVRRIGEARASLGSLPALLAEGDPSPSIFDRDLLRAAWVGFRGNETAGATLLSGVDATVADVVGAIEVVESPTVVLTADEGEVPVTFRNDADRALRVRVSLDTSRHDFPDGARLDDVELASESATTVLIRTQPLTPGGRQPILVRVEDPDGRFVLAEGVVVVRSTAYPVSALAVIIGAAGVLALWSIGSVIRRRRRVTAADVPDDDALAS